MREGMDMCVYCRVKLKDALYSIHKNRIRGGVDHTCQPGLLSFIQSLTMG